MKMLSDLKAGDTAWISDVNSKGLRAATVDKVGRTLIHVGRQSFRMDSGRANDAYGHQTLIADRDVYDQRQECIRILAAIRLNAYYRGPLSLDAVKEAARLLGVNA